MAVEVIGSNANAHPWRADLARVTNKHIAETEKSLKPVVSGTVCKAG